MAKFTLPNGSDSIPLEDMFSEIKDSKVEVNYLWLMSLVSDLHYLQGYCESLEWGLEFWKDKATDKGRNKE